jgi:Tol biopolymer transport system component
LSGPGVRNLRVSPDGERVTFLRGRADNQFQLDLWEYNMKDKTTHRLVDSKKLVPNENLSLEEKARRERARTASLSGILSYSWSPDGKQLLVPIAGDLYLVDVAKPDAARKVASGNVLDPKISPKGRYVSFVRDQNLVVIDLSTGAGTPADDGRQGHHPQRRSRIRGPGRNGPDHRLLLGAGRFGRSPTSATTKPRCRSRAASRSLPTAPK